ncbi:hypothetical protein FPV67DRAFT_1404358 [Lyophyllum atratum]|nr:hypothetical protein FPV67DRAFT_1404358 [Lyophyllum atratum]
MSFDQLPTELYSVILSHLPLPSLQQTVLALTRALPFAPIPLHELFYSVCIRYPYQAPRLYRRLRSRRPKEDANPDGVFDAAVWVHHFSVETWEVDADILGNLIRLLPNLESLSLWIGPSNFRPEHLEDLLKPYMPRLKYLSIRFRPYVKKATYYQFLKGSYFDSTFIALSSWPSSPQGLPTLSIVQDPFIPDSADVPTPRFAQPIVFFRLDLHLSILIHSQALSDSLKSLRIRIPSRPIVQPLTTAYLNPNVRDTSTVTRIRPPSIEFLDVSTSSVSEADIETLLARFKDLKHLILDGCTSLLRGGSPPALGQELDWWTSLGRRCALAGVKKARDREKQLKLWYETLVQVRLSADLGDPPVDRSSEPRRPRRGRRGLATATITLRGASSPPRPVPLSTPASTTAISRTLGKSSVAPKIHIIPPLPVLQTLCLFPTPIQNTPAAIKPEARVLILSAFEKGWNDGIRVIWEKRARMGTSFSRDPVEGTPRPKFLRFRQGREEEWGVQEEGLEGLEDVGPGEREIFFRNESTGLDLGKTPVLCLSGPGIGVDGHVDGCGHSVARDIWMDEL